MIETRHRMYYQRRQYDRACTRELRRSMPRGDALLALYATHTAVQIAERYRVKPWWVFYEIRDARAARQDLAAFARRWLGE